MTMSRPRLVACLATVALGLGLVLWALLADVPWFERHVLHWQCVTSDEDVSFVLKWRLLLGGLGIVVAILSWPFFGRLTRRWRAFDFAASGLAVVAALGVGFVAYEMMLRRREALVSLVELPLQPLLEPNERYGWSNARSRTKQLFTEGRVVTYANNADGFRTHRDDDRIDPMRPTVLVLGESDAYGFGLPWEDTIPAVLGADTGLQVVNAAVIGYGQAQAYLQLQELLPRFEHVVAVVVFFVPEQIHRAVLTRWPYLVPADDGSFALRPPVTGLGAWRAVQGRYGIVHGGEARELNAALMSAMTRDIRAVGARPLFVVTNFGPPCRHPPDREATVIEELFVAPGLPFVRVDLFGPEELLLNNHPNPTGVRKLTRAIEHGLHL